MTGQGHLRLLAGGASLLVLLATPWSTQRIADGAPHRTLAATPYPLGPRRAEFRIANLHPDRAAEITVAGVTGGRLSGVGATRAVSPCTAMPLSAWGGVEAEEGLVVSSAGGSPVGALAEMRWTSGDAYALGTATAPGRDLVVPLVLKAAHGQSSHLAVLAPAGPADVRIALSKMGEATPLDVDLGAIPAGTARQYDLASNPAFAALPIGFVGWARVRASAEVVVSTAVRSATGAVYAFEPVAPTQLGHRFYVPLFSRARYGSTSLVVVNPELDTSGATAQVLVQVSGTEGACKGQSYDVALELEAGTGVNLNFDAGELPPGQGNPVPRECGGNAVVESTGAAVAIVALRAYRAPTWAITAPREDAAAAKLLFPLQHIGEDDLGYGSYTCLINPGPRPASARLCTMTEDGVLVNPGCCPLFEPRAGETFCALTNLPSEPSSPGWMIVNSSQPLLGVTQSSASLSVDWAAYTALACGVGGPALVGLLVPGAQANEITLPSAAQEH